MAVGAAGAILFFTFVGWSSADYERVAQNTVTPAALPTAAAQSRDGRV
jgi:hypothetical protein